MNFYLYYKYFYFTILQLFIYIVCVRVCIYEELICKNR